jgi:soluble P-type ATPase
MIRNEIPGFGRIELDHLVMDYNGTLAVNGNLLPGVAERLKILANDIVIHVITADTFGRVQGALEGLPCKISILGKDSQDVGKLSYIRDLGSHRTVCVGNGRNDRMMLEAAALGVAVILGEGASRETIMAADVVCTSINDALDLLLHPLRLVATLRS